ncbi:FecR domain-containing protein [Pseudanabaena sp. FACHB-1998]|uniref:FecR family protein n=1 Tax=Pseudanabaena sp. FACHB-1998 TaxID=2692858 RepID=UPI00168125D4|nr:FecR family protein [Pseudanabaena sp. FACHB-1998]MBD2177611.1 FecR domain-containing protein [Pseudanabaena sp. FACHB-1998]
MSCNPPLTQDFSRAEAQGSLQVRTNQWLRVDQVSGNVTYRNLYNYTNRAARVGDLVQTVSDEISTGSNSSAVLSVDTAIGSIYIAENTTIKIRSFQIAPDNGRITNLFVPRGKARLQIRKFTNRGSQLNIQTPSGISGVRGTEYIVITKPNGNMTVTTLKGSVATTAQNLTELVNGGFQNLTVLGKPPSRPVPIVEDASLSYVIDRQATGTGRSIVLVGYTNPFNLIKIDGIERDLDSNGKFSLQLPAPSSLSVKVKVETPQGKVQVYEIPIL